MADAAEWAWAAGLFEGEGTFWTQRRMKGGREYRYANACMSMTDLDVVERFLAVVGVGGINRRRQRSSTRKPMFMWYVADRMGFAAFVEGVRPWLGNRRLQQLDAVLAMATPPRRRPNVRHRRGCAA